MSVASFYQNLGGRPDRRPFLSTLEPSKHADILVIQKVFLFTFWGGWPIPPQTPPIDVTASSRIMYTCTTGICLIYLVGKKIPTQIPDCCRRRQHRQNWSDRHRPFPKFHWTRLLHVPRLKRNFLPIWRLRIQHTVQLHTFWSQSSSKVSKKINYSVWNDESQCSDVRGDLGKNGWGDGVVIGWGFGVAAPKRAEAASGPNGDDDEWDANRLVVCGAQVFSETAQHVPLSVPGGVAALPAEHRRRRLDRRRHRHFPPLYQPRHRYRSFSHCESRTYKSTGCSWLNSNWSVSREYLE